ncbi:DegV family protein [Candidatus Saccharibacteria bacterium]|nr:DegV family protein [Candidatus Saccharibacteria bacterium]
MDDFLIVSDNAGFSEPELEEYLRKNPRSRIFPELVKARITYDDEEIELSSEELSARIESGKYQPGRLKSASASLEAAADVVREAAQSFSGAIIVLSTSSYISSSLASVMMNAVNTVTEETGRKNIRYVDSRATSHGQVLLLKLMDSGEVDLADDNAIMLASRHIHHTFTEPDLSFAVRSGRYNGIGRTLVSGAATLMKAHRWLPWMFLPFDNSLKVDFSRLHTEKRMLAIWAGLFEECSVRPEVIIEFAGEHEFELANKFAKMLTKVGAKPEIQWLSQPIMVHTGPVLAWHAYLDFLR